MAAPRRDLSTALGTAIIVLALACAPEPREYAVEGEIEGVLEGGRVLLIKHDEIPGYMQSMTMKFDVQKPAESSGLAVGDAVAFTLVVDGETSFIRDVERRTR